MLVIITNSLDDGIFLKRIITVLSESWWYILVIHKKIMIGLGALQCMEIFQFCIEYIFNVISLEVEVDFGTH